MASSPESLPTALQLAFCHLFFNITGILLFYPIPKMRKIVLNTAKYLGRTTAQYRWFAIAYLICMFLVFPGFFFAISFAGKIVFIVSVVLIGAIVLFIVVLNVMQRYVRLRKFLPRPLLTWEFLPEFMRSLAPVDRCIQKLFVPLSKYCCSCCTKKCSCLQPMDVDMGCIDSDSDSDDSMNVSYLPSAMSSKTFLASQSGTDLKHTESSRRIYRPKESSSRRNSLIKKSPLLIRESLKEPQSCNQKPLLNEGEVEDRTAKFYISKSDIRLHKPEWEEAGTLSSIQVNLHESII